MDTHSHLDTSIIKVSNNDWQTAQEYESHHMVLNNRKNGYLKLIYKFIKALKNPKRFLQYIKYRDFYCGDDWNYWWMEKFEYYAALPKQINKALEVGSGPYTNIRLISRLVDIGEIICTDPLMHLYTAFRMNWLAEMAKKGKIKAITERGEKISFPNNTFDLVVCNNVLDHVENADECLKEMFRVLKSGGYFVFGQDLSDEGDLQNESWRNDVGHPIKLHDKYLKSLFQQYFIPKLDKITSREEGRHPEQNYGNYIFIGQKKPGV